MTPEAAKIIRDLVYQEVTYFLEEQLATVTMEDVDIFSMSHQFQVPDEKYQQFKDDVTAEIAKHVAALKALHTAAQGGAA